MTLVGAAQQLYPLSWRIRFFGKLASSSTPEYATFILHHQDLAIAQMVGVFPSSVIEGDVSLSFL
jgi:hypothetical protein